MRHALSSLLDARRTKIPKLCFQDGPDVFLLLGVVWTPLLTERSFSQARDPRDPVHTQDGQAVEERRANTQTDVA